MRGRKPQTTTEYSNTGAASRTFILSVFALLNYYAALWMVQDVFPEWQISFLAQIGIHLLIIVTVAVYEVHIRGMRNLKKQRVCALLVPLAYSLAVMNYVKPRRIDLEDGSCALATQFLEKYNRHFHTSFWIWKGKKEFLGSSFTLWMAGVIIVLLILALLAGKRAFLLLAPATVLLAELLVGYVPQWNGISCFFVCIQFAFSGEKRRKKGALRLSATGQTRKLSFFQRNMNGFCLAVAAMALVTGVVFFRAPAEKMMEKSPLVENFQRRVEWQISNILYSFIEKQAENITNQPPQYTGKEVIKIAASKYPAADVYLKGFCASDYVNGRWVYRKAAFAEACEQEGYEESATAKELLQNTYQIFAYGGNIYDSTYSVVIDPESGMPASASDGQISAVAEREQESIDYTIAYTGLHNKYAYLPYAMDFSSDTGTESPVGDAYMQKERNFNERIIHAWDGEFNALSIYKMLASEKSPLFQWYDAFAENAYVTTSEHVAVLDDYLATLEQLPAESGQDVYAYFYNEPIDIEEISYLLYTCKQELKDATADSFYKNQLRFSAAWTIGEVLKQYHTYSTDLDTIPDGVDAVDYFLTKSHKGFCIHFASAAVLLLRELGIPSRYVSGYVARQEDFHSSADGYVASVKDDDSHAWVEIYLDQIGWVPVDVTPGEALSGQNAANTRIPGDSGQTDTTTEDTQADETEAEESHADTEDTKPEDTNAGGGNADRGGQDTEGGIRTEIILLFASLCAALLLYVLLRFAGYSYHHMPSKDIANGDCRKAIQRISRRIFFRLRIKGKIRRFYLNDASYEKLLKKTFPEIYEQKWEQYMQIMKAAAFSNASMGSEDAQFCYWIYRKIFKLK